MKEMTMVMHIQPGAYLLRHVSGGPEVGQGAVVVVDANSVVEHWYLYTKVIHGDRRYDNYITPSSTNPDVEIWFEPTPSLPGFDPSKPLDYQKKLGRGAKYIEAKYIEAKCSDDEARIHEAPRSGVHALGQIDWGPYTVLQRGIQVGEVCVSGTPDANASVEVWRLYTTSGTGFGVYAPPGSGGGVYRIQYKVTPLAALYDTVTATCHTTMP